MRTLVQWAVRNTPAMNTLVAAVLVVGALSFASMRREIFPQFELEIILVTVPYPGASPEEVEEGICQKVEEAVRSVDGIKRLNSIAQEGAGYVILELQSFVDPQKSLSEIRSQVDRIPSFPELAEDPEVEQLTFTETAIRLALTGPPEDPLSQESELRLRDLAERVRDDLLALPTISKVNLNGTRPYQIDIEISESRLREFGLSLAQVAEIVRNQNIELPGGSIKAATQEILLRGKDKQLRGADIARIPLVTRPDGVALTIGDLGTVRDAFEDVSAVSRIDGLPGVTLSVDRSKSEDILKIVDQVKDYVARAPLPAGYQLRTWFDQSQDVRDRMHLLSRNGIQGLILVFAVLAIFMDLRLSFWVAMGIPIAVLGAGAVLLYMGQTLNMLSMFAFLMALGIVVDDAIVIGENIYEHRQQGKSPVQAAIDGTVEVIPSVCASVGTTIIAFVPLLFVSGVMGKFIAVMPLAVIAMLAISLIESMIVLPCHLSHVARPARKGQSENWARRCWAVFSRQPALVKWTLGPLWTLLAWVVQPFAYPFIRLAAVFRWLNRVSNQGLVAFVEGTYLPLLNWSIKHSGFVICTAYSVMFISLGLARSGVIPYETFPEMDAYLIEAVVNYPDGTPESVTDAATLRIEQALRRVHQRLEQERGESVVRIVRRAVGEVQDISQLGPDARSTGSHVGKVDAELIDAGHRSLTSQEIAELWREEAGDFPGCESLTFGSPEMGPGGTPIEFRLLGRREHMQALEAAAEDCKRKLTEYDGVVDIRDDSRPGKWEIQLKIKDKARSLGITLAQLSQTVRGAYYGEEAMRLQRGRHEVKLMVRYPRDERRNLASLQQIRVRTPDGREYPLTELAEIHIERGYAEINRIDQRRAIAILADINSDDVKSSEVVDDLRSSFLPGLLQKYPEVSVLWEGQQEQTADSVQSMIRGLMVAILAMFVLLTLEFRSYVQPLIILAVIPFGVVGAIWGHGIMGMTITIFTMFGLVALTGVVVNDSIVLVDFINQRLDEGDELNVAIITAGRRRFRPVLLTSVTTMAGLTPMMLETSFQAQFLIPLAVTMVFGIALATVMVLILVPVFYVIYRRLVSGEVMHETPEDEIQALIHVEPSPREAQSA